MEPEITEKQTWYVVEGNCGTDFVPADVCAVADIADYVESSTIESVETMEGYGARLSASGYLDCTDWSVFDSIKEAAQYLIDTYYDFADDEMSDDEKSELKALENLTK